MKVREFDLSAPLPFSQGYAIKTIAGAVSGSLEAAGEVTDGGPDTGAYLYLRFAHTGEVKRSESIWFDDGYSNARCVYKRVGEGSWEIREGEEWIPVELELSTCA